MFLNQNQLAREVNFLTSRVRITVNNIPANLHDREQFLTITLMRYGLEADLQPGTTFQTSAYRRVIHSISAVDLKLYAMDCKNIKLSYIRHLETPQETWLSFKRKVSGNVHYKWIFLMVEKLYSSPAKAIQWLAFDERLQTTTDTDISSEIEDYIEYEAVLAEQTYPQSTVTRLQQIVEDWLADCEPAHATPEPQFGPGATATTHRVSAVDKLLLMHSDVQTQELFCDTFFRDADEFDPSCPDDTGLRRNRIIFVPKNALKHRIISAEPVWLTWYQQLLKNLLFDYVEKHPRMFTWFSNQANSRALALKGSIDGNYSTIDFSSASDSNTATLIDELSAHTPVHDLLMNTRSTEAELPDGTVIHLEKFAPMGSATCFVMLDITLLAVCELAVRTVKGRMGNRRDYIVYGDDVIIRTELVPTFTDLCKQLHFDINREKSYCTTSGDIYRESCGIEALNGVDITPLRYSRFQEPIYTRRAQVNQTFWESTVDLINRLQLKGFGNTRSACTSILAYEAHAIWKDSTNKLSKIAQTIWYLIPRIDEQDYCEPESVPVIGQFPVSPTPEFDFRYRGIGTDLPLAVIVPNGTATNYRCRKRYNKRLQRWEIRCLLPVAHATSHHTGDEREVAAYNLWFYAALRRSKDPCDHSIDITGCAGHGRIKWSWQWCSLG